MGFIKAFAGAIGGSFADQWKDFYVPMQNVPGTAAIFQAVPQGTNAGRGENTSGSENIISNGSKIVVPQGFAMMIVDNGAIKEFSAEPGEYIWDTSSEPSVFEGGFVKGITDSIKRIGDRITYGGQPARDQRVYYVNLLNITGNKFGSSNTETVFDPVYGSVEINFYGEYSFKVVDPTILVSNLIGANPKDTVTVDEVVGGQLKMQFASNVSTCISNLMTKNNISFNTVQSYKNDVVTAMNTLLDESWHNQYGLEIQDVALNINASEESKKIIREVDAELSREKRRGDLYSSNPSGLMAAATADAMKTAAGNDNGAMMGFMGMNMGQTIGGNAMGMAQNMTPTDGTNAVENPMNNQAAPGNVDLGVNTTAKFCSECGASVTGKFCSNCGKEIK